MSDHHDKQEQLQWSGERYVPEMGGNIRLEHLHRYFLARELAAGKRVLDIACGEGYGSALLADVATRVVGVDIAPDVVAHANSRYQRANLDFEAGSCSAIPLADGSMDLIVCFETIEHLDDHEAMMREFKRVLAPGGAVIISTPDRREYSDLPSYANPFHVRELYRHEFEQLLSAHFGFVTLVGQRIWAGSFAWALERPTESPVKFDAGGTGEPAVGPLEPLYVIGIASDAAALSLPSSLLDAGGFVWPEDYVQALRNAEDERHSRMTELAAARNAHDAAVASLQQELGQQRAAASAIEGRRAEADGQLAMIRSELAARVEGMESLERARADLSRTIETLSQALDEAVARGHETETAVREHEARVAELTNALMDAEERAVILKGENLDQAVRLRDLADARAEAEARASDLSLELDRRRDHAIALEASNARLEQTVNALIAAEADMRAEIRSAEGRLEQSERLRESANTIEGQLRTTVGELESLHRSLTHRLALVENSLSWRLMSPLRAVRAAIAPPEGSARRGVLQTVRAAYWNLPMSVETRLTVKTAVFRSAPFLFRGTPTFEAWEAYTRARAQQPALPVPAVPEMPGANPPPLVWFENGPEDVYVPLAESPCLPSRLRAIAFYLPQFHPVPENDLWWGRGFTEWDNVARGRPRFDGHYQPHLPGELGFYDLRLVEVQRRQIELARLYGVHGFCYHHYWFGGRRLLRRPLDQVMADRNLDLPFCLCWANENWTRRWDGREDEVLMAQHHSPEDDLAFIRDIDPILRDPRYIRVEGRPLLVIYRPALLPDAGATAWRWREYCRRSGIGDLFLVSTQAFDHRSPQEFGFDAATEFAPNNLGSPPVTAEVASRRPGFNGTIYDYEYLVERSRHYVPPPDYELFRCVAPMWDNEPRRPDHGKIFMNSTPARYAVWLENACRYADAHFAGDRAIVFINAWNEWAEGAHLEPDRRFGYAYLQATADVLQGFPARARSSAALSEAR